MPSTARLPVPYPDPSFALLLRVIAFTSALAQVASLLFALLMLLAVAVTLWATLRLEMGVDISFFFFLSGTLLSLVSFAGFRHLSAAVSVARRADPFHGEVSERLRLAGQRFVWVALLFWLVNPPISLAIARWAGEPLPEAEPWISPGVVVFQAVSLAVPLLLIALAHWLDEGRQMQDRAREVI